MVLYQITFSKDGHTYNLSYPSCSFYNMTFTLLTKRWDLWPLLSNLAGVSVCLSQWRTTLENTEEQWRKPQQQKRCYVTSHAKSLKGCNFCLPVSLKKLATMLRGSSGHKKGPSRKKLRQPPWEWILQAYRWLQS